MRRMVSITGMAAVAAVLSLGGCGGAAGTAGTAASAEQVVSSAAAGDSGVASDAAEDRISDDSMPDDVAANDAVSDVTMPNDAASNDTVPNGSTAADVGAETAESEEAAGRRLLSADGKYQIRLEEGFEDAAALFGAAGAAPGFAICAVDSGRQAYLLFAAESKDESVFESLADYRKLLVEGVTESSLFSDVSVGAPVRITLSGTGFEGTVTSFTALYHPAAVAESSVESTADSGVEIVADSSVESAEESRVESAADDGVESAAENDTGSAATSSTESGIKSVTDDSSPERPVDSGAESAASSVETVAGSTAAESVGISTDGDAISVDNEAITAPEAIPIVVRLYTLEGVRDYYQFMCWTSADQSAAESLIFDRMVNSLRILK